MRLLKNILTIAIICSITLSCTTKKSTQPLILTTIAPYKTLIQTLLPSAKVQAILPSGASPTTYELSAKQLTAFQQAEVYVTLSHLPIEKTLISTLRVQNKKIKIISLSQQINTLKLDHHHHDEVSPTDPHYWLDPMRVSTQIHRLSTAFQHLFPADKNTIKGNEKLLTEKLTKTHISIQKTVKKHTHFLTYHPSFGYFCDAYDVFSHSIEHHGHAPSLTHLNRIKLLVKTHGISTLLIQEQFNPELCHQLAKELNLTPVTINLLDAGIFATYDKLANALSHP